MLAVPHIVFGAALGEAVSDLPGAGAVAFGIGWASHYFLDSIPHWERMFGPKGSEFSTETPAREWPKPYLVHAFVDLGLALLILAYLIWRVPHGEIFYQNPVFWGALGGLAPDLIDNVPFWNKILGRLPVIKQLRFVHRYMHISEAAQSHIPKYMGLITQLGVFVFSLWILLSA